MRIATVLAAAVAALSLAGPAAAATIGVNEDETKTDTSLYAGMADVGLKQNVLSVIWTPGQPISSGQVTVIKSAIAAANAKGIKIVLAIYNSNAPGVPARFADTGSYDEFIAFVTDAVKTFRGVKTVIIGNEPNRKNFMSPPKPDYYGRVLAGAYAAVKSVDPSIEVLGAALSPRGDNSGNLWPTDFVKQIGDWYRTSDVAAANRPLMDGFSIHPYPDPENRAPDRASDWPQVNMADLHRIKQAISDAFAGTPQKTVEGGLPLHIDEIAYQVPTEGKPGYTGSEAASVNLVSEQEQAEFYAKLVNMAACDPQIASLNFFHFIDEKSRVGFQSGFLDLAKTERPVVSAVRNALAATNGGSKCVDTPVTWRPTTNVIGAKAQIPFLNRYPKAITSLSGKVRVEEHAEATMALYPSRTATLTQVQVATIADQLADGVSAGHVATSTRDILAAPMAMPSYMSTVELKLPDGVRDGHYFVGLTVRSKLNPKRVSTYVSTVFLVGNLDSAATATTATATTPRLNAIPQPCLPRRSGGRFGAGVPNAVSGTCENGLPRVSSCAKGFLDINGTYADGCELVRRDLLLTAVCREQWLAINNSRTSYAKLRFAITLTAKPRAPGAGDDVFGLAPRKAWKVRFEGVPKGARAYLIVVDYRGAVQTVSGPVANTEAKDC